MARRIALRLTPLSRADLMELAIAGCAADLSVLRRADALISQRAPLPRWCVDVLLSADLLPHVLASLTLSNKNAAVVCSTWAAAWAALLRKHRYLRPRLLRTLKPTKRGRSVFPITGVVLPGGQLCVLDARSKSLSVHGELTHSAVSILDGLPFRGSDMLLQGSNLYVGHYFDMNFNGQVAKYWHTTGSELARSEALPGRVRGLCLYGEELFVAVENEICVLDAQHLQLLHTFGAEHQAEEAGFCSCAVHGGHVYVGDEWEVGTLKVFDRSGHFQRRVHGVFGSPRAVAFHHDRLYLIENEIDNDLDMSRHESFKSFPSWELAGFRLLVMSMDGHICQAIHLPEGSVAVSSMHFHENQVYLFGGPHQNVIHVFELTELGDSSASSSPSSTDSAAAASSSRARRSTHRL